MDFSACINHLFHLGITFLYLLCLGLPWQGYVHRNMTFFFQWTIDFDLGKRTKSITTARDHLKISKIAKFGREMLQNEENIAQQISKILYTTCIKCRDLFGSKVKFAGLYVSSAFSQHFATKLCNFTNF